MPLRLRKLRQCGQISGVLEQLLAAPVVRWRLWLGITWTPKVNDKKPWKTGDGPFSLFYIRSGKVLDMQRVLVPTVEHTAGTQDTEALNKNTGTFQLCLLSGNNLRSRSIYRIDFKFYTAGLPGMLTQFLPNAGPRGQVCPHHAGATNSV